MKKIMEFCRKHKTALIVVCSVAGTIVVYAITRKHYDKLLGWYKQRNVIAWKPTNKIITLEKVKEVLDLNANTSAPYAIFREGPDPKDYVCIVLNDTKDFICESEKV